MRFARYLSLLCFLSAGGCASLGAHKIASLDSAIDQGPPAVKKLCEEKQIPAACALSGAEVRAAHTLPILQGISGEKEARVVVLAPKGKNLRYYLQVQDRVRKLAHEIVRIPGLSRELHQLHLFDLDPAASYTLMTVGPNAEMWDRRVLRALDTKKKRARIAVVSCMDDALADVQSRIWPELLQQAPDAILMIGDNTYADRSGGKARAVSSIEQIWRRYAETRAALDVFKADPLVPVIATWDDHDYGKNDGDRTFTLKDEALGVFFAFFPQRQPFAGFRVGPGVSSWWTAFGVNFALLDDRSFRSPNRAELPDQTHFGVDQEKWLKEGLAEAKTPVFLISGDQFFGGYHGFESYEGSHPASFKKQLDLWRATARVPLVFMSGDRHLSEIIKVPAEHLGYPSFEITSSGVHAKVFPEAFKKAPSPLQLAGVAGEYNYSIVEIMEAGKGRLQLDVKSFGLGRKMHYQKTLMVKR